MATARKGSNEGAEAAAPSTDPDETPSTQDTHGSDLVDVSEDDPAPAENVPNEKIVEGTQEVGIPVEPQEGETGGQFPGDPNRYPKSEEDLPRGW